MLNPILIFIIPFAFISILQDLKTRKVKNYINLPFLYFSTLFFVFHLRILPQYVYPLLILSILIAYYLYHKNIWGGADGKIFIALSMIILTIGNYSLYLDWIINLSLIYILGITSLIIIKTSPKKKLEILKATDYNMYIFQILLLFLIFKNILKTIVLTNQIYSTIFLILVIIGFRYLTPQFRKYFDKFSTTIKTSINILLTIIFIATSYSHLTLIYYFIFLLIFRIITDYIANMTVFLKNKEGKKFYSPFTLYLFISVILTLILTTSFTKIIQILSQ